MKTKVAVCGQGPMGLSHAKILKEQDTVELVAIADVDPARRKKSEEDLEVPGWNSGEELIDAKIADVIFVCAPTYLHAPLSIRALEAGHHVFSEKPMGLNSAECAAMIKAAETNNKFLTVGQVLRFWPEYVFLKKTVESGEFGKLQTLSLTRIGKVSRGWQNWFLDEKLGGTQIFDRHIHDTDLVLWLLGKPQAVSTFATKGKEGGFVHSFTRYQYPDVTVSAEGSADLPDNFPFTMAYLAVFENGAIEYNSRQKPTLSVHKNGAEVDHPELPAPIGDLQTGLNIATPSALLLEQIYFLDCIKKGVKPAVVTPESARDTVAVVRLEMESARTDTPVAVE